MKKERRWRLVLRPRHVVTGIAGLGLAWLVVVHSGAAFLASRSLESALALDRDEPEALVALARRTMTAALTATGSGAAFVGQDAPAPPIGLEKSPEVGPAAARPPGPPSEARAVDPSTALAPGSAGVQEMADAAKRVLRAAPYDARALVILAQLADAAGDKVNKSKLLDAIVRRTKHEPLAVYWLMLEAAVRNDDTAVVHFADILLSKHAELSSFVVPVLAQRQERSAGNGALQNRLRENPPWRARFFAELLAAISNARTPLDLLLALKDTPSPPTQREVGGYLDFLMRKQLYEFGYYAWLQFLPPDDLARIAIVNNGGFEEAPGGTPFDWTIPSGSGAIVDIRTPSGESGRALYVGFVGQGRVDLQPVSQTLVLQPGRYRLLLRQKGEVMGRRGTQWTVTCAGSDARIGESQMFTGSVPDWTELRSEFTVPAEKCRAQTLRLIHAARSASEQLVKGTAWYDDIRIERVQIP